MFTRLQIADGKRLVPPLSTLVFNIFVWCQIFNMINCRQLGNHFNVFKGMHRNPWLLGILAISKLSLGRTYRYKAPGSPNCLLKYAFCPLRAVIGGQILIVFVGGAAFGTEPIPIQYWAVSIAFGAGSLVVGALARLIPDAPLGQALIALRIMPDVDSLPRSRPKQEDEDQSDQLHRVESCRFIGSRLIRRQNSWLYFRDLISASNATLSHTQDQGRSLKGQRKPISMAACSRRRAGQSHQGPL